MRVVANNSHYVNFLATSSILSYELVSRTCHEEVAVMWTKLAIYQRRQNENSAQRDANTARWL